MADEIAQACQLEIEGIKMVVKGSVETAQLILRMIRSIISASKKGIDKYKNHHLELAGEKEIHELMQLSKIGPPQIISIPEDIVEQILEEGSEKGLHFSFITDTNPNDHMIPIAFTSEEASIWSAIIKSRMSAKLDEDITSMNSYATQIAEEKEKLINAATPEEKQAIEIKIENLEQAQREVEALVKADQELVNKEELGMSLTDYLRTAKGTEMEINPDKAIAELEKGVEISPKISAKECFQPIRDINYMPDTEIMFYLPDTGSIISRKFVEDKDTGLMYSNYYFKTNDGEVHRFTDHNITSVKWNDEILPTLLDKANMIEGTECKVFDSEEKLHKYLQYHDQVRPESEIKIEQAIKEGKPVFNDAETEQEVMYAVEQKKKGLVSARVENDRITISVEPNQLVRQNGKLSLALDNGDTVLIPKTDNERVEDGKAVFEIEKDAKILHLKNNPGGYPQTNEITGEKCKELIDNAAINTAALSQKQTNHR